MSVLAFVLAVLGGMVAGASLTLAWFRWAWRNEGDL